MKKIHELDRMNPARRRRFLKWMGLALGGTVVSPELRFACMELGGGKAYAQAGALTQPTYFIEVNLRDQWDQGHVMVAPSLAANVNLPRGDRGENAALFYTQDELTSPMNRVFLTADSRALTPHLENIAMVDSFPKTVGATHGHEAANELRIPGRDYSPVGRQAVYENDPTSNFPQGGEAYYARTPSPATLHNYYQQLLDPTLRSGVAFKGISRSIHTVYHFAAGLPGAELDRVRSKDDLFAKFPAVTQDVNIFASSEEATAFRKILERADKRHLERLRYTDAVVEAQVDTIRRSENVLYMAEPRTVSLELSAEEEAYWGANVPRQQCTSGDVDIMECSSGTVKAQIWEQMAYAFKLITSGVTRTVALEFDFMDLHGYRPEFALRTQAQQLSYPLARLIQSLKDTPLLDGSGTMFDRTLIAVYTADGSRSPKADSYGGDDNAKNTLILAGGMIKGGYFGDVSGNPGSFGVHAPDPVTGAPLAKGTRATGADGWRTVMKALEIPDDVAGQFADASGGKPLRFMLRG